MNIAVVVTTYFPDSPVGVSRLKSTLRAVESWARFLTCEHSALSLIFVNSCGVSPYQSEFEKFTRGGISVRWFSQNGGGVGASLNLGFKEAFKTTSLALYAADDWALTAPLDLTPWSRLLQREANVGMVRLGPPHADLTGKVQMFAEGWGLLLDRHHYSFGHRPALYHRRMLEAYGPFTEKINALECERLYNESFCRTAGPEIVLALPHPWEHVGETEVGDLEP